MSRFFLLISSLLLSLICLAASIAAAQEVTPYAIYNESVLNQVVQRHQLIVGMEVEFWPFEYADEQGKPAGFDVEIARLMAQELGVELVIKDMEWAGLIPALQSAKVDMVISGMTGTLERAKTITFSDPYFITGLCTLVSVKRSPDVAKVDQLNAKGKILALKTGTTADLIASKRFTEAELRRFKDETACVREVVEGRADAFFYDQISIAKHHKQNPDSTRAIMKPFTYEPYSILGKADILSADPKIMKPFTYEPYSIAIRKGDFDFWNWINRYLETIKADGRYDELFQKYFADLQQAM